MMHGWGWGMYGGWLGMFLSMAVGLAILIGFVFLVVWLARRGSGPAGYYGGAPAQHGAKEILQQRYARGEITRDQYREMLAEIEK